MHVAVWGIPTAICAFLIHGFRLWLLDRKLERELRGSPTTNTVTSQAPSQSQTASGDRA